MLAQKYNYDNYAYDNYAYDYKYKKADKQTVQPKLEKKDNYRAIRHQVVFLFVVGILCYFGNVAISEMYVVNTGRLVNLKKQEATLLGENQTLKLDVDRLSSPERITAIASSKLGMSTARSNIYVHMNSSKIDYDGYAYAKK